MSRWPIDPARVALGDLEGVDDRELDRLMSDPQFAAEVRALSALALRLGDLDEDAWAPEEPPGLDPAMFGDTRVPLAAPRTRWWARRWMPAFVGALGSLILVIIAVLSLIGDDSQTVALRPVGDTPGTATVEIGAHEMHLVGHDLPPSAPGTHYEAWLDRANGSMVSIGTFTVGADGNVDGRMELTVDPGQFTAIDVSLEPNDGNPAHSQTSVFHAEI